MKIVLDAMGSDARPMPEIEGAIAFVKEFHETVILVGNETEIFKHISKPDLAGLPIETVHAEDSLEMDEKAVKSAREKPNNSMAVGLALVKEGKADAFVTAGNTGAAMFTSLRKLGRIQNVARPALTTLFPTREGFKIILDIGANADCRPEYLLQFALMGSVYAEKMLKIANPRIGLLNNGEEEGKGNELARNTFPLLKQSGLNFIGNIEGRDAFVGKADVIVTDGFSGNVFLKSSEGAAKLLVDALKESLMSSFKTKIGALLSKSAFQSIKKLMDPNEFGAAPLLGIDGLSFVAHGRSNSAGIISSLKLARQAIDMDLIVSLRESIQEKLAVGE